MLVVETATYYSSSEEFREHFKYGIIRKHRGTVQHWPFTSPDHPMARSPDSSPAQFLHGPITRYSVLRHGTNSHLHPLVCLMPSLDLDLQIIVAEGFAHFGATFRQCDRLDSSSHKATTRREVLLRCQIPQ